MPKTEDAVPPSCRGRMVDSRGREFFGAPYMVSRDGLKTNRREPRTTPCSATLTCSLTAATAGRIISPSVSEIRWRRRGGVAVLARAGGQDTTQ